MPKIALFETFNAVKQQIAENVEKEISTTVVVDKAEAVVEPAANPPSPDTTSSTPADSTNGSDNPDDTPAGDEFSMDDLDPGEDDESSKDDEETKASEESFRVFTAEAYQMLALSDKISLGFEQAQILAHCFDEQGDLNLSQESYSVVRSQQWVTGHQLLLGESAPKSSMDVYYASESLKETLAGILHWIIEKIKSLIEWIKSVAVSMTTAFSYDSMMQRFKSIAAVKDTQQNVQDLLPEYNRILELIKQLNVHNTLSHAKFSALYRQAQDDPKNKELLDKLISHHENLVKSVKHYESHKTSTELTHTIDLDRFSGILENGEIKDSHELFNTIVNGADAMRSLHVAGLAFMHLYKDLRSEASKIDSVMVANMTDDVERYMNDNLHLFESVLSKLDDASKTALRVINNNRAKTQTTERAQTYGPFSLNMTDYKINPYGNLHVEFTDLSISNADFKKLPSQIGAVTAEPNVNDFKSFATAFYGLNVGAINAYSSFRCYITNQRGNTRLYSVYKDPATAAVFYDAWINAVKVLKQDDYAQSMSDVTQMTKVIGKEIDTANYNAKNLNRQIENFSKKSINLLAIFDDRSDSTKVSLDEHMKKLIGQSYVQLFNYCNVKPLLHALLCYRNAKYVIERNIDLLAALQQSAFEVERTFKYFIKLNSVVINNSYEIKKVAQELIDNGVDASFFMDIANKNIHYWAELFEATVGYKKKVS